MEQLDFFTTTTTTTATTATTPTAPVAPADVQLSLFRPDFRAMRTPKVRSNAKPAPIALDPALHDGTLV